MIQQTNHFTRKAVLNRFVKMMCVLLLSLYGQQLTAQSCGSCTVTISGRDTLTYTVTAGNMFCIDSTGRFEGKIILSGGTVCNKGVFSPKSLTLTTGNINNYSLLKLNSSLTLNSGSSLTNGSRATVTIAGGLTISSGSVNNAGITDIKTNLSFNTGSFTNSAIVNCKTLSGSSISSISNSGVINKN